MTTSSTRKRARQTRIPSLVADDDTWRREKDSDSSSRP
jgi:hypothetical protein